jgi:hypothetical protein
MTTKALLANQDGFLTKLLAKVSTGIFRILVLIILALCYFEGKNMLNAFIAESPEVTSVKANVQAAQDAVVAARATADRADTKADQSLAIQAKIFEAIKESHADIETLRLTVTGTAAQTSTQIQDLGGRLSRIEAKQDASH